MTNSSATTITPSREVAKVLTATVRRAVKLAFPAVGTENLLIALSAADGAGTVLAQPSLRAKAVARSTTHWADDDAVPDSVPDAEVTALLREANEESTLPETGALRECLRAAIADADGGVLTTTHLALALLRAPTGRAAELFTVHRVDREQAMVAVRAAAKPEDTPVVWVLRKAGALHGDSGGGYVRWLTRLATRAGDLGGPVLLVVRNEAERHAARAGRSAATAIDLMAAVLTVDEQLTNAGLRLRPEYQSGGAAALRAAGVDAAALLAADVTPPADDVDKATAGAKLVAARHGHAVVGTTHLLIALLDNPALRELGVDTAALRAALSSP